jgi:hypothetical protein
MSDEQKTVQLSPEQLDRFLLMVGRAVVWKACAAAAAPTPEQAKLGEPVLAAGDDALKAIVGMHILAHRAAAKAEASEAAPTGDSSKARPPGGRRRAAFDALTARVAR